MSKLTGLLALFILAACTWKIYHTKPETPTPVINTPAPVVVTPPAQTPPPAPDAVPVLVWEVNHPERQAWSKELILDFKAVLPSMNRAQDATDWCSRYEKLDPNDQAVVWATMAVKIAYYESSWDPNNVYHEPPSLGVDSIGLFQMSYSDSLPWCILNQGSNSLKDPLNNIKCAVNEMAKLVSKDGIIASGWTTHAGAGQGKGLARYWSTMWTTQSSSGHIADIKKSVRALPLCN